MHGVDHNILVVGVDVWVEICSTEVACVWDGSWCGGVGSSSSSA